MVVWARFVGAVVVVVGTTTITLDSRSPSTKRSSKPWFKAEIPTAVKAIIIKADFALKSTGSEASKPVTEPITAGSGSGICP